MRKATTIRPILLGTMILSLVSCVYDHYDNVGVRNDEVGVRLTISTRAISSDSKTYEEGTTWENYIDIAGGDYRIYFFTYNPSDQSDASTNNSLIAEFNPKEIVTEDGKDYTQYTLSGSVGEDIAAYSNFKVVVLANWGNYPSNVSAGTTTIDDLVESENSTFTAETFLNGVDADHLIPFYGVREYSGVEWKEGWRTTLSGDITLLRAVAKVEVVMSEDSDIDSFDDVSIVRYNESGYCAPAEVYLQADYDHNYSWDNDFTSSLHLVGGQNSTSDWSAPLIHQPVTSSDTWTIYLPEYDNLSDATDYSLIQVKIDGEEYEIYFANYEAGFPSSTADYDISRNCIYRFYVTVESVGGYFRVYTDKWDDCFDNDYTFGVE